MERLFWLSAGLLVYVYCGYPVLLSALVGIVRHRRSPQSDTLPTVSLIISAHNERRVIAAKLGNTLALDYPEELFEAIVISDASDDGSDEVVEGFAKHCIRLIRQEQRLGKTAGLNLGVSLARGDILVFSDCNAIYRPDALRCLVWHFADPKVGYVVGNQRYAGGGSESARSEGLYWKLETWMKQKESQFGSVVGGDGAIYAIRRELYAPLLPTDINDFVNPLQIICKGYRGLFEPAAVCYEEPAESFSREFHRKTRIISRSLNALFRVPGSLNPFRNPRHWFMLLSHKVLRWLSPLFLFLLLVSNIALCSDRLYRGALALQVVFYLLAFAGWVLSARKEISKVFYLPYYFCLVNWASFIGLLKFVRRDLSGTWTTIRQ